jgi:uncharacterized protein
MKKLLSFLFVLILLVCVTAYAHQGPYLSDNANIISSAKEQELVLSLDRLAGEYDCNIGIITVDKLNQAALMYAHSQYDAIYGPNTDGILLVLNTEVNDREWAISFNGRYAPYENYALMNDTVMQELRVDNYERALTAFILNCEQMLSDELYNRAEPDSTRDLTVPIIVSLLIGLVVATITVLIMKRSLKSVRGKSDASQYIVKDSFELTKERDIFLYSNVTRVPIPRNTSSNSSSGGSRGGASGRF